MNAITKVFSLRNPLAKLPRPLAVATCLALAITVSPLGAAAQPKPETLIRLAGSYTLGSKAALEMAKVWAKQLGLPGVKVEGGIEPDEYDVVLEGAEDAQRIRVQVRAKGTGTGFEPLVRGQADIWMASRQVNDLDIDSAKRHKVQNVPTLAQMQANTSENVVGIATLAVITSPKNPVTTLTYAQVRDLFTGKLTNWNQVGGKSSPVAVYALDGALGHADAFCAQVMGVPDTSKCLDSLAPLAAPRFNIMDDLSDAVAGNPSALGFVGFAYRRSARPLILVNDCGSPVEASLFRVKVEEYPLQRRMYFYTMPGRAIPQAVKDFIALAVSPAGQGALAAVGLANLTPSKSDDNYVDGRLATFRDALDAHQTRVRGADVTAFEEAVANSDRLSITFRFQSGTNNLDTRAEADITRLAELMHQPPYVGSAVTLIGFSSAAGVYDVNRQLSRDRATAVRDRLVAAGLNVANAIGVGPGGAVACNLNPSTAPLNQRVEVWVARKG